MLSHFFKITLRNLLRQPLYTGINLASLTLGMVAATLIGLWVQNELRFDTAHSRADQIWRVTTDLQISPDESWYWGSSPLKITELAAQIPGVEQSAQVKTAADMELVIWKGPLHFIEKNPAWVSEKWFETFDYTLKEGSIEAFFDHPNGMLLSESKARLIFGDHQAPGQTLRIDSMEYMVCGVLADPSPQSSFQYEIFFPVASLLGDPRARENEMSWNNFNYNTFIELRPDADPKAVAAQLTEMLRTAKQDSSIVMGLQALADMHFDTRYEDEFRKGNRATTGIFALIAILLLGMGCINYLGLVTARASTRVREIGIKKVNGARDGHIFGQIFCESVVMALAALVLSTGLAYMALPFFNRFTEKNFQFAASDGTLPALLGAVLSLTLLLSGLYPALLLSRFRPMAALRSQAPQHTSRSPFRQGLVVFQFAVTAALLFGTIVIWRQQRFIAEKPLGYDRSHIFEFFISWQNRRNMDVKRALTLRDDIRVALDNETSVADVSMGSQSPVHIESTHSGSIRYTGMAEGAQPTVSQLNATAGYAALFNLQLLDGRWFEPGFKADSANVVINETAARELNLPKPWVGQAFEFHGNKGQVIGVLRDFHFKSLHKPITPLVVSNEAEWHWRFFVKTQPGSEKQAIAAAEKIWKSRFPNQPFQYKMLDDNFQKLYGDEKKAGQMFSAFAGLAVLISCMGLLGLAVFASERRVKEIGIRKVLGASVASVAGLLVSDFLKLVLIAIAVASPVAWYFMNGWLADFAYRIDIKWWMFAVTGAVAIAVALLTVGFQALKAALANPVKSLRSE